MDQKIYIFARFRAKPEKREELLARLKEMVVLTNLEPGCVFYHLHVDSQNRGIFYFMECWQDQKAFDFHMQTPYIQSILRDESDLTIAGIDISFMDRIEI
jgi:quinol monooxygenase YgiN